MKILPHAPQEPQELDLLGSAKTTFCIHFFYKQSSQPPSDTTQAQSIIRKNVTPNKKEYNEANCCNYTSHILSESSPYPKVLLRGVFPICGDRVWVGIPLRLQGGPCSLGQLTTLTPKVTLIKDWKQKDKLACTKRSYAELDSNCDDPIYNWGKTKRVAVSIFLPWVASAKALSELSQLGCWLSKQTNTTSAMLSDVPVDKETTRHATLQNRAAIDFLLLAHGHGCKGFERLCCFNLTSHSTCTQANIKKIQDQIKNIKAEVKTADWLHSLFTQWGVLGWAVPVIRGLLWILVIIAILALAASCFMRFVKNTVGKAFIVNKEGGNVVSHVEERGAGMPWEVTTV